MTDEQRHLGVTVLGSGSKGNATVIHTSGESILLDAGFSCRELRRRLKRASLDEKALRGIVVSHEHTDHVKGLRVCAKQLKLDIYCNRETAAVLRHRDDKLGKLHIFAPGNAFRIGSFMIEPFSIPHDASDPMAFVIQAGDRKIGVATDLGHVNHLVAYQLRKCDLVIVESNHDIELLRASRRPWSLKQRILGRHGHLSNRDAMELLRKIVGERTRHILLAHASQECNEYEIVERLAHECMAELGRDDIMPVVALQDTVLPTVWV